MKTTENKAGQLFINSDIVVNIPNLSVIKGFNCVVASLLSISNPIALEQEFKLIAGIKICGALDKEALEVRHLELIKKRIRQLLF